METEEDDDDDDGEAQAGVAALSAVEGGGDRGEVAVEDEAEGGTNNIFFKYCVFSGSLLPVDEARSRLFPLSFRSTEGLGLGLGLVGSDAVE